MSVAIPTRSALEARILMRLGGQLVPLTDLTPIAVLRQIVRAMIVEEIAALWAGLTQAQRAYYLQTAAADGNVSAITRRIADFGVAPPPATVASGAVTVAATAAVTLMPGASTQFLTQPADGSTPKSYQVVPNTNPDATQGDPLDGSQSWNITAGASRSIPIVATTAGAAGNTPANTITTLVGAATIASVTNPSPLANGSDALDATGLWQYFKDWLGALSGASRGALLGDVENFTDPLTGRNVHSVALQEWDGTTLLRDASGNPAALLVFIDEGTGNSYGLPTADSSLVRSVQALVDGLDSQTNPGVRAAGVPTGVIAASAFPIAVQVTLIVDPAYAPATVQMNAQNAILAHFVGIPVSGTTVLGTQQGQFSLARLNRDVLNIAGVLEALFITPASDIAIHTGWKAVAGAVSLGIQVAG